MADIVKWSDRAAEALGRALTMEELRVLLIGYQGGVEDSEKMVMRHLEDMKHGR
jgi:hypothetical protein